MSDFHQGMLYYAGCSFVILTIYDLVERLRTRPGNKSKK